MYLELSDAGGAAVESGRALKAALGSLRSPRLGSRGRVSAGAGINRCRGEPSPPVSSLGLSPRTLARVWQCGIWAWRLLPPTEGVKIASHPRGLREARELLGLIYLAWFPLTVLVNQFGFDSKNNSVLRAPHAA